MARQVNWTETALSDLEQAAEYIARDSPSYATSSVRRAFAAAASLDEFAQRGRVVPELGDTSIREIIVGSYRLIYRTAGDTVHIIAFVHGARDLPRLWEEDDR